MNTVLEKNANSMEYQNMQNTAYNSNMYYNANYNTGYQQNSYMNNQSYQPNYSYTQQGYNQTYNQSYAQPFENQMSVQEYVQTTNLEDNQAYARQMEQYQYIQSESAAIAQTNKKEKMNVKVKLLIGVYFFIVAVIATLLLVNMALGGATANADGDDFLAVNEDAINFIATADGSVIEVTDNESLVNYDYDVETNWFDEMCDNITNKAGK